jgi:hypothetical protein
MSTQLLARKTSARLTKISQSYNADQQVKYLHIEAEIEVLIQQLQNLSKQKAN